MSLINSIKKSLISFGRRLWSTPVWLKIAVVVALVVGGWFAKNKLLKTSSATPQYQTTQATKGTVVVSISASGQVSTANSGSITTEASGVVKTVFVKNGDTVKSGAKIAELDLDQAAKQKYIQATASYQSAKNSLASAQATQYSLQSRMFVANQTFINDAVSRGLVSGDPTYIEQNADWLAAEASYINQQNVISQAQTSVNSASMSLQQSSPIIYSPITGTVTGLALQPGAVLTSSSSTSNGTTTATSQKVASIQTQAAPTISVSLTEIDAPKIKIGDKASLTFDALPTKTFTGKVISLDTIGSVSSSVTTYPAVIQLDTNDAQIFSNMSAQVNITTDTKTDVLIVPSSAVTTSNGQSTVRVLKNGQSQPVTVTTGLISTTETEITSGLNEGDEVVTSAASATTTPRTSTTTTSPFSALGGNRGFGGAAGGGATRAVQITR